MWSGKCPVGEMSVRGNVLVGKCPVGEVPFGEVSGQGIVRSGKCSSGKCQPGNCPVLCSKNDKMEQRYIASQLLKKLGNKKYIKK